LEGAVHVACVPCELATSARHGAVLGGLTRRAIQDVRIWSGNVIENRLWQSKAFGQNRFWGLREPVVDVEACSVRQCKSGIHRQRMTRTYPARSKSPSSKARRYSFSLSKPWIVCAWPLGKYQMSPKPSSDTSWRPFSSTAEMSMRPKRTWPHSACTSIVSTNFPYWFTAEDTYDAVPMQLTDGTLLQMLLSGRNVMALWQVLNDLLAHPTTGE